MASPEVNEDVPIYKDDWYLRSHPAWFHVKKGYLKSVADKASPYHSLAEAPFVLSAPSEEAGKFRLEIQFEAHASDVRNFLELRIRDTVRGTSYMGEPPRTAVLLIPFSAFGSLTVEKLSPTTSMDFVPGLIRSNRFLVWKVELNHFDAKLIASSKIFVTKSEMDLNFSGFNLCELLKQSHTLSLLVHAGEEFGEKMQIWVKDCQRRNDKNPFAGWLKGGGGLQATKAGDMAVSARRPKSMAPPRHAFVSWSDYHVACAFARAREHEHVLNVHRANASACTVTIVILAFARTRRFMGYLKPMKDEPLNLKKGTTGELELDDLIEEEDPEAGDNTNKIDRWTFQVISPHDEAPDNSVTVCLTPACESDRKALDPNDPKMKVSGQQQTKRALPPRNASLCVDDPLTNEYHAQMRDLQKINDASNPRMLNVQKFLTGAPYDYFERRDLFNGVPLEKLLQIGGLEGLYHERQLEFLASLTAVKFGVGNLQGPPGTGKTWLLIHFLALLLDEHKKHDLQAQFPKWKRRQVLLTAQANNTVTLNARLCQDICDARYRDEPKIVIRCHSAQTDKEAFFARANKHRGHKGPHDEILHRSTPEAENDLDVLTDNADTLHFYKAQTRQKYEAVRDQRLQDIELSLGYRMIEKAGLEGQSTFFSESDKFRTFRDLYRRYRAGKDFEPDSDDEKTFDAELESLRQRTLETADVVCCTLSCAAEPDLFNHFKPAVIVVDEAARAAEATVWPLFANYDFEGLILAGDIAQLPPWTDSTAPESYLAKQNTLSLQHRLQFNDFDFTRLNVQHRMSPEIAFMPSWIGYHGKLLNARDADRKDTAVGIQVRLVNKAIFKRATPVIFLSVMEGTSMKNKSGSKSSHNMTNLGFGMQTLDKLLSAGVQAKDIVILTPYKAQRDRYETALQKYRIVRPRINLEGLEVKTVDAFQGYEHEVVILDLVATRNLDFIGDRNRLVVATSRARTAMYVIGDGTNWQDRVDGADRYYQSRDYASSHEVERLDAIETFLRCLRKYTVKLHARDIDGKWFYRENLAENSSSVQALKAQISRTKIASQTNQSNQANQVANMSRDSEVLETVSQASSTESYATPGSLSSVTTNDDRPEQPDPATDEPLAEEFSADDFASEFKDNEGLAEAVNRLEVMDLSTSRMQDLSLADLQAARTQVHLVFREIKGTLHDLDVTKPHLENDLVHRKHFRDLVRRKLVQDLLEPMSSRIAVIEADLVDRERQKNLFENRRSQLARMDKEIDAQIAARRIKDFEELKDKWRQANRVLSGFDSLFLDDPTNLKLQEEISEAETVRNNLKTEMIQFDHGEKPPANPAPVVCNPFRACRRQLGRLLQHQTIALRGNGVTK